MKCCIFATKKKMKKKLTKLKEKKLKKLKKEKKGCGLRLADYVPQAASPADCVL